MGAAVVYRVHLRAIPFEGVGITHGYHLEFRTLYLGLVLERVTNGVRVGVDALEFNGLILLSLLAWLNGFAKKGVVRLAWYLMKLHIDRSIIYF